MREGRGWNELRPIEIIPNYLKYPEGSALIRWGDNLILASASVEDKVPPFLKGTGKGWITAEYSMLPRATERRSLRDVYQGRPSGRSQEIQRLIGRALRAVTDLSILEERTIIVDCDVLQADGGTRVASIAAGAVALYIALKKLVFENLIREHPMKQLVAAVSLGIVEGEILVDLDFSEDSRADVDMNLVVAEDGSLVEIQVAGEGKTFQPEQFNRLLEEGMKAVKKVFEVQREVIRSLE